MDLTPQHSLMDYFSFCIALLSHQQQELKIKKSGSKNIEKLYSRGLSRLRDAIGNHKPRPTTTYPAIKTEKQGGPTQLNSQ